jgi:hypothetical protein
MRNLSLDVICSIDMSDSEPSRTPMSEDHKAALAEGREQGRAVRRYLEALEANRPKRGRKRTKESMEKRLQAVENQLPDADPLKRLHLVQEKMDLQKQLESEESGVDMTALEEQFIAAAKPYSSRKGISFSAWRELGVPTQVLTKAGITRSSK